MDRLERLKELLAHSPEDAFLLFAIAKEYESSGSEEQALAGYLKLKNLHPDYIGLYYHLGKLLEARSRPKEAMAVYREGMEVAGKIKDHHALRELSGAAANLDPESVE